MWHVNGRKHAEKMQELYEQYSGVVVKHALCFVKNRAEAEDICQEAFLRLDRNLYKVPDKKVKAWLFNTAGRLAVDYLRHRGREYLSIDEEESPEQYLSDERTQPEWVLERMEENIFYQKAMERLKEEKPRWFQVMEMSYLEEMSNRQIAKELGISANLVSQWKHRATDWLRKAYGKED